jgi:hypothetical protein
MNGRRGFLALLGAGLLVVAAVSSVGAAQPVYSVDVTKTADPAMVPAEGGDVTFTVHVLNDGDGSLATVLVDDPLAGCTLGAPTGDDGNGTLDVGETWDYNCLVTDVSPDTENTATVNACHNASPNCKQDPQRGTDSGSVTVTECESDCPTPSVSVSPSDTNSSSPSDTGGGNGNTNPPATDTIGSLGTSAPADSAWLLVVALGVLLGSLVVLRPSTGTRHR